MANISEIFGSNVFNEKVMKERLPKSIYESLKKTQKGEQSLTLEVANVVAHAMKEWAIEKGATHYTHWFQPLTGITAEKHDSFIQPDGKGGVILEFSGKNLIKGEPDASSFPSGGIRATFEARGYTAWDPTSYAFIKEGSLCIPTAFCSYTGESLDKKTPLLRSMEALSKQGVRLMKLFGHDTKGVSTTVGAEQEYFLIDEASYKQRKDLRMTGRTLFGSAPSKGQEMDDQYFAAIKPRVVDFMADLDKELWSYGVMSKTKHNEVAPAQHEMAPIFTTSNLAVDQNQLVMEIMKKTARKHGLVCLLHEKPFDGLNGSGKHNNWSLSTVEGMNLLEPGDTPAKNAQFLLVLTAVMKAVDENQALLRMSVASAGNDHRLGANEAPPAIISMFVGDDLGAVLKSIKEGTACCDTAKQAMKIGVDVLPAIAKDTTDRNRTSPFAFTGNKFEFRSVGSSLSLAGPNTVLNTAVASAFDAFATRLENASDFEKELNTLIKEEVTNHYNIVFNGNGYDASWVKEAEKRGLLNLRTLPDAMKKYLDSKNVSLFTKYGVYSETEMKSHYEVKLEKYAQVLNIEVNTMLEMVNKDIIPAIMAYMQSVSSSALEIKELVEDAGCAAETKIVSKLDKLLDAISNDADVLSAVHKEVSDLSDPMDCAYNYAYKVIPAMEKVRASVDEAETMVAEEFKPFPSYEDILFF